MAIYWQTQKLHDGETGSFDFSGVAAIAEGIAGYAAGMAGFQLAFDGYHHRVQGAGVVLDTNLSGEALVQVTARLHLDSDSGDRCSRTRSWVFVTVLVWVDVDADTVLVDGVPHLPGALAPSFENASITDAALSAFWFSFGHGEGHRLSEIDASLDVVAGDDTLEVDGSGAIQGGDSAGATLQLGAAVLATSTDEGLPLETQVASVEAGATDFGRSNSPASATFSGDIATATALLTSFDIAFDEDRDVSGLVAGAMTYDATTGQYVLEAPRIVPEGDGKDVVVTTNLSMFQDHSRQSTSNQGTFLVIASHDANSEVAAPSAVGQSAAIPDPSTIHSEAIHSENK